MMVYIITKIGFLIFIVRRPHVLIRLSQKGNPDSNFLFIIEPDTSSSSCLDSTSLLKRRDGKLEGGVNSPF